MFVADKPDDGRHDFGDGVGHPEHGEPEAREKVPERHKADDGAHHSKEGAFEARAHCLEEGGEDERGDKGQKARAREAEPDGADADDFGVGGEDGEHLSGERLEDDKPHRHEDGAEEDGRPQRLFAAADILGGIVEADDGHDARLHGAQGDEEEGLPLVVEPERRHRLVGKARKDEVEP